MFEKAGFHSLGGMAEASRKCEALREKYIIVVYDGKYKNRAVKFGIVIDSTRDPSNTIQYRFFDFSQRERERSLRQSIINKAHT